MKKKTSPLNLGAVVSVRGSVVDIRFDAHLPHIYSLLHTKEGEIAIEVLAPLDAHHVRGIALTPTQGLARGGEIMTNTDDRKHRAGVTADRSQFFKDLTTPFYGANRKGHKVTQGMRDAFWFQGMQGGLKSELDSIKAFSETDFTEDLKKFDVPTLIIHGDDDQIVPIAASAMLSSKLVKNATLKIYTGGAHGLADTHKEQLNTDLLAFLKT